MTERQSDPDPSASMSDGAALAVLASQDPDGIALLVARWTPAMLRMARVHVASAAAAEDVVQDSWIALLMGIERFTGSSSLRSYVLGIVAHKARRAGERERRTLPLSGAWRAGRRDERAPSVSGERFDATGRWRAPPPAWPWGPEESLGASELHALVEASISRLPVLQRAVITASDGLGLSPVDVAMLYGVSSSHQRVLLHRARAKVRSAVEEYVNGGPVQPAVALPRPVWPRHSEACQQLVELLDDYLAGRLDVDTRRSLETHLSGCDHCGEYVTQVRRVLSVTSLLVPTIAEGTLDRLVGALSRPLSPPEQMLEEL